MRRKTNYFTRIVSTILAIYFTITVAFPIFAGDVNFTDVKKSDWFYESVRFVNEKGYMKGVSNTSFDPVGNLTRGMCVTILYRIAGEPETNGKNIFSDVKVKEYFTLPVIWASNNGIVYGRTETTFVPNGTITRAEFSAMLFRYISSEALSLEETRIGSPADYDKIPSYAKDAVLSMFRCGIINGREGGIFDPDTFITRAEAAAMIERFVRATRQLPHIHSYKATVSYPTCTKQGYTTYTCECGDSYVDDYVVALGHEWGTWIETIPATSNADGEKTRTCSRCGASETEPIPSTGPENPTTPRVVVLGAEAFPGGSVTLIVSIDNNPGFNAFNISIVFDGEVLTLDSVSLADGIPGQFGFKKYAVWINDSDYSTDGPLLVLSFTVNEGVSTEQTQVTVSFEDGDFSNYAEEDVFLEVVPGVVKIVEP